MLHVGGRKSDFARENEEAELAAYVAEEAEPDASEEEEELAASEEEEKNMTEYWGTKLRGRVAGLDKNGALYLSAVKDSKRKPKRKHWRLMNSRRIGGDSKTRSNY